MADGLTAGLGFVLAANAALLLAVCLLWISNRFLALAGLARDWTLRRRLTGAAWLLGLLLPTAFVLLADDLPPPVLNATDMLVAQYLRGNLAISATDLSHLIELRDRVIHGFTHPGSVVWRSVLAVVLVAGAVRASLVLHAALRLRHVLADARPLRRSRCVTVYLSTDCDVPFAARGLRRHHVVMPAYLAADRRAFRIALVHEMQHIRQGDPLLEMAVALLSPVFALNPAFWSLARQTRRLRENDCDAACVARPGCDVRSYSLTLLAVARRASDGKAGSASLPGLFSVPFVGRRQMGRRATRSQLGSRIELLARRPARPAGRAVSGLVIAAFCTALAGSVWLLRDPSDWSHERLQLSSVLNLERLASINTLGQRPLR